MNGVSISTAAGSYRPFPYWLPFPGVLKGERQKIWKKVMADPAMQKYMNGEVKMPFDGKRMFWGGFKPVVRM